MLGFLNFFSGKLKNKENFPKQTFFLLLLLFGKKKEIKFHFLAKNFP
jgi:hypothetical protein